MAIKKNKIKIKNKKDKRHFLKDFKAELKKVIWPTPKQLFNNTVAVIFIVFVVTVIVLILDLVFETFNKYGVNKIKEAVSSNEIVQENVVDDNTIVTENVVNEVINTNTTEGNAIDTNIVE